MADPTSPQNHSSLPPQPPLPPAPPALPSASSLSQSAILYSQLTQIIQAKQVLTSDQIRNIVQAAQQIKASGGDKDPEFPNVLQALRVITTQLATRAPVSNQTSQPGQTQAPVMPASAAPTGTAMPAPPRPPQQVTATMSNGPGKMAAPPTPTSLQVAPAMVSTIPIPAGTPFNQQQLSTLKAQIMAFRYISKNAPVPPALQQAVFNAGIVTSAADMANSMTPQPTTIPQKIVHSAHAQFKAAMLPTNSIGGPNASSLPPSHQLPEVSDPYQYLRNPPQKWPPHKLLIPSITPLGVDPQLLALEREKRIRGRIEYRMQELEKLPSNLPSNGLERPDGTASAGPKIKALIELKALKLLEKQKKLRTEIIVGMKQATTLHTAISRTEYRRMKKQSLREARITEKLEKQQRLERERREKQKHIDFLNGIITHGREMLLAGRQAVQKQQKLGRAVLHWHNNVEKEEQKRQERLSKQRLQALKADDEEAYLKLIDKQKDTRIAHLLSQTNQYLETLANLVSEQQREMDIPEVEEGNEPGTAAMYGVPTEEDEEIETQAGKIDYYAIAHRVTEVITEQPNMLSGGTLKDYQVKGLQWMVSLYNNRLNGILADEMGLGKTIQTIALVSFLIEKKKQNGPFLIVVPLSTITNWSLEFEKWAPDIYKVVYKGTPGVRKAIQQSELRHGNFNVLLTTYEYIIKDKFALAKIKWQYLIVDEGHRMKNQSSKLTTVLTQYYSTRYRLILTGTPLQNNLPELWALLNFILPRIFNSVKTFDEWFNTPFANTGESLVLNEEEKLLIIKRLHKVLRPFLLRRLKRDVESELPDKVERILKCPLSGLQQRLYNEMRRKGAIISAPDQGNGKNRLSIKGLNNTVMQLRKICNHPYVFEEVESIMNPLRTTDERIVRVSGKFELLDRILPKLKVTGHRVLVFFQMTHIMNIMEDYLMWKQYKYLRLDGSTKAEDRSGLLKVFNAPDSPYFIFLLSTRAGGLGLNLQTADTVIIFDSDWNPHQDLQAQDRAHRIGQTKEVRVLRLITSNSIEETILSRAQFKLDLDGKVIQAGKFDNKSTAEEREAFLRALLEANPDEGNDAQDSADDEELNEIIARDDNELELFRRMDDERERSEQDAWEARGGKGPRPPRLITEGELPETYQQEFLDALEAEEEQRQANLEFGRGARSRKEVRYDDGLTEEQWVTALEDGKDLTELVEKKRARALKRAEKKTTDDISTPGGSDAESEGLKKKKNRHKERQLDDDEASVVSAQTPATAKKGKRKSGVITPPTEGAPKSGASTSRKKRKKDEVEYSGPDTLPPPIRRAMTAGFLACWQAVRDSVDETGRSRAELFLELPSRRMYPHYYVEIKNPIALDIIMRRIPTPFYKSIEQFKADFNLMFRNACTFNVEGSQVYNDSVEMEKVFLSKCDQVFPGGQVVADQANGEGDESGDQEDDEDDDKPLKLKISLLGKKKKRRSRSEESSPGDSRGKRRKMENDSESSESESV